MPDDKPLTTAPVPDDSRTHADEMQAPAAPSPHVPPPTTHPPIQHHVFSQSGDWCWGGFGRLDDDDD